MASVVLRCVPDVDETPVHFAVLPVETGNFLGRKKPAANKQEGDKKAVRNAGGRLEAHGRGRGGRRMSNVISGQLALLALPGGP